MRNPWKADVLNVEANTVNVTSKGGEAAEAAEGDAERIEEFARHQKVERYQASIVSMKLDDEHSTTIGQLKDLLREAKRLGATKDGKVSIAMGYGTRPSAYSSLRPEKIMVQVPPHWRDEEH